MTDQQVPAGASIDKIKLWVADKGGYTLAFDFGYSGTTAQTCAAFPGQSAANAPTPCATTVSVRLAHVNDSALVVKAPKVKK